MNITQKWYPQSESDTLEVKITVGKVFYFLVFIKIVTFYNEFYLMDGYLIFE